jgi:hypothetical protein
MGIGVPMASLFWIIHRLTNIVRIGLLIEMLTTRLDGVP